MSDKLQSIPDTTLRESKAISFYDRVSDLKINDIDSFLLMGELLREVKKIVNAFEAETKGEIKQANDLHKALLARHKKWSEKFEAAEKLAKEKMAFFHSKHIEEGIELPDIEGVSFANTWSGNVTDESLIPREYLMPDTAKLTAITKALKEATCIPGWTPINGKTVSVRS